MGFYGKFHSSTSLVHELLIPVAPIHVFVKSFKFVGIEISMLYLLKHLHFLWTKSESVINILRLLILDYSMFLVYPLVIKHGLMENHPFVRSFFHLDAVIGDFPTQPCLICKGINWISASMSKHFWVVGLVGLIWISPSPHF
jgi:hypothetical protein